MLACNQAFSTYHNSEFNIGMRFHANVCSIAMQKPTIGLAALDRVLNVFENMGIAKAAIQVDGKFSDNVVNSISDIQQEKRNWRAVCKCICAK
ncbi:MAG: polysaccharide pyruvyl transferase family protein [Chitinophagaceae bacterium]|nr:polysaccharide pyruvyl transferase family protein [Chitinophagaceae bacterium]